MPAALHPTTDPDRRPARTAAHRRSPATRPSSGRASRPTSWPSAPHEQPACARCRRDVPIPTVDRSRLDDPEAVAALVVPLLGAADREHCVAVMLDTKHRVIEAITVSVGSLDHTFMAPREILRDALLANAAATVLAHNHPSGDPEPSRDDERVTRRIVEAGRVVGIEVLDHLVVGGGSWVSLARRGLV